MQFPTDTALATYLASTDSVLYHELKIDWDNTGFTSMYTDVSDIFESITIERALQGDIPAELNVVEGYSVAKMDIVLSGRRSQDTLDIIDLVMSPTSPLVGSADPIGLGCAITYRVIVPLSGTPKTIDQFVGVIRTVDPQLDGTVKISALDLMDLLSRPVSLKPIGVDYLRMLAVPTALSSSKQQFNMTWAIDQVLRQCGLYCSPARVTNSATKKSYFCATMNGSWWPDLDELTFENPIYETVDNSYQASDVFIAGQYGYAANGTVSSYGQYRYVRLIATWVKGETQHMGAWVFGPRTIQTGTTTILCDVTLSGDPDIAGRCQMQLALSTSGVVTANLVQLTGQSYNVTFTGPTISGAAAWHYVAVGFEWRTSNSGVTAWFNVDGTVTPSVSATVLNAFTIFKNYATIRIQSKMPIQSVQWWKNISGTFVWPIGLPTSTTGVSPQTSLDLALSNLTAIPDIYKQTGLDVMAAMLKAELGVLYSTESGVITFQTRDTVNASRSTLNSITVTEEDLAGLVVHLRNDSFINSIVCESSLMVLSPVIAYTSDLAERFDTAASTTGAFIIYLKGIHSLAVYFSVTFVTPWPSGGTGVTTGFYVIKISDGTVPAGVTVNAALLDQDTLEVDVINTSASAVRIATATEPALHIGGFGLIELSQQQSIVSDATSIALRGKQEMTFSRNDWSTVASSVVAIATSLLADVKNPKSTIDPVELRCDPRVQLNDQVFINTDHMGSFTTSIIGYTRKVVKDAYPTDTYTLRVL